MARKLTKAQKDAFAKVDFTKVYSVKDAVKLVKETSTVKFDASVEIAFNLGIDPKQADQQLRAAHNLPHGSGKSKTILVIAEGEDQKAAKDAGADYVGADDMIEKIKVKGWMDFDIIVCTPSMMSKLGVLGQILGPKGLMPNPKTGTVTSDVTTAVKEIKAGKIEFKNDKEGNVNLIVGKVSFDSKKLEENIKSIAELIKSMKPAKAKGTYFKGISISSSMGPGIKVSTDF